MTSRKRRSALSVGTATLMIASLSVVGLAALGAQPVLKAISAGGGHTCAVDTSGGVWCWGSNSRGQLGDGTLVDSKTPAQIFGFFDVVAISAGREHSCALSESGAVWCWGRNSEGQLGVGDYLPYSSPVRVDFPESTPRVSAIESGDFHTCATTVDFTLWCWGSNVFHQVNSFPSVFTTDQPRPVIAESGVKAFGAGYAKSCSVGIDGAAGCWGELRPVSDDPGKTLIPSPVPVTSVSVGFDHGCLVLATGEIWCFGDGSSGQLGVDESSILPPGSPSKVGLTSSSKALAAGAEHTCALLDPGSVWCWGDNLYGQLGTEAEDRLPWEPSLVSGLPKVSSITAGDGHTCSLTEAGSAFCWGHNQFGQLGDGKTQGRANPVEVVW